jgi:tetratricopeptide (TPR) repeat protein
MAEAHHYKISRKTLREPDEFQHRATEAFEWFRANQFAVVSVLVAAAVIGGVVLGVNWYGARQRDAAAVRLQGAQALFEAKKYGDAATEFAAIAAEYAGTPAGRIAPLYRGHALAAQPDPAAAATAYSEYLAASPETDYLRQEALLGLARAKEATNDVPAALDAYRRAADIAAPFRTQAQLAIARIEDAAGNADAARALYAELAKSPELDAETRRAIAARVPGATTPPTD